MPSLSTVLCTIALLAASTCPPLAAQTDDDSTTPTLENLGPNVNSEAMEIAPVLSPDGRTLYFQRFMPAAREGQEHDLDIYYSTLGPDGTWSQARSIGSPLNSDDWNGMCSILPDGNTAFIDYVYDDDGNTSNGLSMSHRTANGWSQPEEVTVNDMDMTGNYINAYLCNDGRTLLLAIERDDSYGERDLYVSFLNEEGDEFSEPINLGSTLNTPEEQTSPFLAADGVTLYFGSEGHGGFGDRDIFLTRRLDDTWKHWSTPENLGPTINSSDRDAFYTISAAGDYAYLSSYNNSIGEADIFRIKLSQPAKPKPVVLVSGHVFNAKTKQPIDAQIRYELLSAGKDAGLANATVNEGYKVVLPAGARYGVRGEAKGFYAINENLDLSTLTEYREQTQDLYLAPIEVGTTIRLNNIFFETGKAELEPESFPELDRVVKLLEGNSGIRISIAGHTDNIGADAANVTLSKNRARAVYDYLVAQGIDSQRLASTGFGEHKPVAKNDTDEGRQMNRRVDFTIVAQ